MRSMLGPLPRVRRGSSAATSSTSAATRRTTANTLMSARIVTAPRPRSARTFRLLTAAFLAACATACGSVETRSPSTTATDGTGIGRLRPIVVETPGRGARVPRRFHVAGTASVFEATLVVELVRDGTVLVRRTVTASEGAPGRGTFDARFSAPAGPLTIRVYSPSAANGKPQHEVDVHVAVAG
jgi:hypothetical protein